MPAKGIDDVVDDGAGRRLGEMELGGGGESRFEAAVAAPVAGERDRVAGFPVAASDRLEVVGRREGEVAAVSEAAWMRRWSSVLPRTR